MAGIEHDTCSKPAMSITGDPWSTTGSAAHSPRRSTQLLLPPAAQAFKHVYGPVYQAAALRQRHARLQLNP